MKRRYEENKEEEYKPSTEYKKEEYQPEIKKEEYKPEVRRKLRKLSPKLQQQFDKFFAFDFHDNYLKQNKVSKYTILFPSSMHSYSFVETEIDTLRNLTKLLQKTCQITESIAAKVYLTFYQPLI